MQFFFLIVAKVILTGRVFFSSGLALTNLLVNLFRNSFIEQESEL